LDKFVILGKVVGVHGLKGDLKVFSFTKPRENILSYKTWLVEFQGDWKKVSVSSGRRQGKNVVAHFMDIENRESAEQWIGCQVAIERSQLATLEKDEYYWADLVGLQVFNLENQCLGQIDYMLDTGANDVMVLKGDQERLVPWLMDKVVLDVDLTQGIVKVDWDYAF
jgi:16S rRNA processing protein RimM